MAPVGGSVRSRLSLVAQHYTDCSVEYYIGKKSFVPEPKVYFRAMKAITWRVIVVSGGCCSRPFKTQEDYTIITFSCV